MKKWSVRIAIAAAVATAVLMAVSSYLIRRLDPYAREQTIAYLEKRFQSKVDVESIQVESLFSSPWRVVLNRGRNAFIQITAQRVLLRQGGRMDLPPMLTFRTLRFQFELASLANRPVLVRQVRIEGLELTIPPKGERPKFSGKEKQPGQPTEEKSPLEHKETPVIIDTIVADGTRLIILPKKAGRAPLKFDILKLKMESAASDRPMSYDAVLTNPEPDGLIESRGTFGPFDAGSPGETPLSGDYTFSNADLGVFKSVGGIMQSTGRFSGKLNLITVDGETRVPDFHLGAVGNKIPLATTYHAIVDGTNGDTFLEPVEAKLGKSAITVRGSIARNEGENGKTVALKAISKSGRLDDFLRLAVRGGKPPLSGGIALNINLEVPPGKAGYAQRLIVSGRFTLNGTTFQDPKTQEKMDDLSRRAQGQPNNARIAAVPSGFRGTFDLRGGLLRLKELLFDIPGAAIALNGSFDLNREAIDFKGVVRTESRVSQMAKARWKRVLLRPVDPFFAKDGSGAVFYLRISGTRDDPEFQVGRKPKK